MRADHRFDRQGRERRASDGLSTISGVYLGIVLGLVFWAMTLGICAIL